MASPQPIVKATNCVLVMSRLIPLDDEKPCIRCGECARVCPIQLLPQQLFWYACSDNEKQLRAHGLTDCIECGCCDLVCPSHIPLTADFRKAKAQMREMADEIARAERARRRFESRNERLDEAQQRREEELQQQKKTALSVGPDTIRLILLRSAKRNSPKSDTDAD